MEIREVLHIGVGRCGNHIVDGLVRANGSFIGLLYNTAANDLNALESYLNEYVGAMLIPNADGSGKDRDIAKTHAINNRQNFEDMLSSKYSALNNFVFYFSMDGGTGSGCAPELIRYVHELYEGGCTIHIVAAVRSKLTSKIQLENTKACWNDINVLRSEGIIKSIMLIDNDLKSEQEVNDEVVKSIIYSYSMKDLDYSGAIDSTDMAKYFNAVGYRTVYRLNNNIKSFEDSLKEAIEESVFLKPEKYVLSEKFIEEIKNSPLLTDEEKEIKIKIENDYNGKYKCEQLLGLIQSNRYKVEDVLSNIKAIDNNKIGEQNANVIGLSGMDVPLYKFDEVVSKLKMATLDASIKKKEIVFYEEEKEEDDSNKIIGRRGLARKRKSVDDILNKDLFRPKSK